MVSAYGLRRRSSREQSTFFLKIVKLLHNDSNPKMQSSYLLTRALVTRASAEIAVRRENVMHARQSTDYHCSGAVHYALVTFPRGRRCWRGFFDRLSPSRKRDCSLSKQGLYLSRLNGLSTRSEPYNRFSVKSEGSTKKQNLDRTMITRQHSLTF